MQPQQWEVEDYTEDVAPLPNTDDDPFYQHLEWVQEEGIFTNANSSCKEFCATIRFRT
jgi:hypothetical protein